jgi:hypothetical protein
MKVLFRNKGTHPYTMHPHGVKYDKNNEGALYQFAQTPGDDVPPGGTFEYTVSIYMYTYFLKYISIFAVHKS